MLEGQWTVARRDQWPVVACRALLGLANRLRAGPLTGRRVRLTRRAWQLRRSLPPVDEPSAARRPHTGNLPAVVVEHEGRDAFEVFVAIPARAPRGGDASVASKVDCCFRSGPIRLCDSSHLHIFAARQHGRDTRPPRCIRLLDVTRSKRGDEARYTLKRTGVIPRGTTGCESSLVQSCGPRRVGRPRGAEQVWPCVQSGRLDGAQETFDGATRLRLSVSGYGTAGLRGSARAGLSARDSKHCGSSTRPARPSVATTGDTSSVESAGGRPKVFTRAACRTAPSASRSNAMLPGRFSLRDASSSDNTGVIHGGTHWR